MKKSTSTHENPNSLRDAHRATNVAWAATHRWIGGWINLTRGGSDVSSKNARQLMIALFPNGLDFLDLSPEKQWIESEQRLAIARELNLEVAFRNLGGEEFLDNIRESHESLGEVLGILRRPDCPRNER